MIPNWLFRRWTLKKLNDLLRANAVLLKRMKEMSQVHDTVMQSVNALASEVKTLSDTVTRLVAEKTENEQSFQDVTTELESLRSQVASATAAANAALADNATQGSSTGAGSGATTGA